MARIVLGTYVRTMHGQEGRVYKLHFSCPESDEWLQAQSGYDARVFAQKPWASILCATGGAVTFPLDTLEVIEPLPIKHPFNSFYFGEGCVESRCALFGQPHEGGCTFAADPSSLECAACGAEPGEECRPGCLGEAAEADRKAETYEQASARLDAIDAALDAREARLDRIEAALRAAGVRVDR